MKPIARILCPVDFSEVSQHAAEYAAAIASWYGASITGFHVYSPIFMPVPGLPAPDDRVPNGELGRVWAELDAHFQDARAGGLAVDVVVDVGRPAEQILAHCQATVVDLIVMGTHGTSGFEHLLLGSVTEKVLRKAVCPVLTVPPRAHATSKLPFSHILCALDFSNPSLAAWDLACSVARRTRAALVPVHVIEWPWHEPPAPDLATIPPVQAKALADFRRCREQEATDRLTSLIAGSDIGQGRAVLKRVVHGKPYEAILRVAEADNADLIVMGVHGRNAADLAIFGSTTNHVVRAATCPVLSLRA